MVIQAHSGLPTHVESCRGKWRLQFLRKHEMLSILTKFFDHRNLFELVRRVPFGIWDGHCITSVSLLATAELPLARAFAHNGWRSHEGCNGKVWSKGNLQHHSWFDFPFLGLLCRSLPGSCKKPKHARTCKNKINKYESMKRGGKNIKKK